MQRMKNMTLGPAVSRASASRWLGGVREPKKKNGPPVGGNMVKPWAGRDTQNQNIHHDGR